MIISRRAMREAGWGAGVFWDTYHSDCLCEGRHHFQSDTGIQRREDGVVGNVVSRTRLYLTVQFPDGIIEIDQFDPRYVNV